MKIFAMPLVLAALMGIGTAQANIQVGPSSLFFGSVGIHNGFAQQQQIRMFNDSAVDAVGIDVDTGMCMMPDFNFNSGCFGVLPAHQECLIWVTFKPTQARFYDCIVRIRVQNASGEADIQLSGQGNEF